MSFFEREESADPQGMEYMHEVDVALHRRGHPLAFTLSAAVLVFFAVFLLWAHFATIDSVTRGMGKVAPAQGVRPIQLERGGTITHILVKENDEVQVDQPLAHAANVQEASALRELQARSIELAFTLDRLDAESDGRDLEFSPDDTARYPAAVQNQMLLFTSRRQQFAAEDQQLLSQIEQRKHDEQEARGRREQTEVRLQLLEQEERTVRPLVPHSYSEIDYLDLKSRLISLRGELLSSDYAVRKAVQEISAAEGRLAARRAERKAVISTEASKSRLELEIIRERMKSWDDQVTRTTLRSPVHGTVKNIILKEGSVARPAEVIMEILPTEGSLEVVARFTPADRGFLYVGQQGMVKFDTYDFSIYGGLEAVVDRIGDDTIQDHRGESWYEVRLTTKRRALQYQGQEWPILPGMTASIDLLTDKRTVLDTILGPLRKARQNAMTER